MSARPGRVPTQGAIWAALLVVILGVAGVGLWSLLGPRGGASPQLPLYGKVPDFALTERSGRRVGLSDLLGKVWVANFIYTHCPDTCPLQSAALAELQRKTEGEKDFWIVSITVDPDRDTPEVLARYGERFGADPVRWLFLTGEKRLIYRLAQEGFRLSVAEPEKTSGGGGPPGERRKPAGRWDLAWLLGPTPAGAHHPGPLQPFLHSARFALVDRRGAIRGYYGVILRPGLEAETARAPALMDDDALRFLLRDAKALLREG